MKKGALATLFPESAKEKIIEITKSSRNEEKGPGKIFLHFLLRSLIVMEKTLIFLIYFLYDSYFTYEDDHSYI